MLAHFRVAFFDVFNIDFYNFKNFCRFRGATLIFLRFGMVGKSSATKTSKLQKFDIDFYNFGRFRSATLIFLRFGRVWGGFWEGLGKVWGGFGGHFWDSFLDACIWTSLRKCSWRLLGSILEGSGRVWGGFWEGLGNQK